MEIEEGKFCVEESTRLIQELWEDATRSDAMYSLNIKDVASNMLLSTVRGTQFGQDFIIDYAVTRPECRHKGYAKRLIDRTKERFPDLYVLATEDAVGFWIKHGFTRTDEDKAVLNQFEDTYLLKFVSDIQ